MSKKSWKWLFRSVVALFMLGAMAYLLLPWYLPSESIRKRIVDQLQRDWDHPVAIGSLSVGWTDGIQLANLVIQDGSAQPPASLIQIERIQLDLSPWQLYRGRLDDVTIENIRCNVTVHDDGTTSIDKLIEKMTQPRDDEMHIRRIHLDRADIQIEQEVRENPETVTLKIGACELEQNPDSNGLSWIVQMHVEQMAHSQLVCRGRIAMEDTGRLNDDLSDQIQLSIGGLDLAVPAVLPLVNTCLQRLNQHRESPLPMVNRLSGSCALKSDMAMLPNGNFDIKANLNIAQTNLKTIGRELPWLNDSYVSIQTEAAIDPATGVAEIADLRLDGSGLQMEASGRYDPRSQADKTITLSVRNGRFEPVEFYRAVPFLGKNEFIVQTAAENEGTIRFGIDYSDGPRRQTTKLHINADDWGLTMVGIYKQVGDPLSLTIKSDLDRDTGKISIDPFDLKWLSLHADAKVAVGGGTQNQQPTDIFKSALANPDQLAGRFHLDIGNFDDVVYVCEHVLDLMPGLKLTGPVQASIEMTPGATDKEIKAYLKFPESTQCSLENLQNPLGQMLFVKPSDQPVELEITGKLKTAEFLIGDLNARCSIAKGDIQLDDAAIKWSAKESTNPSWSLSGSLKWRHLESVLASFVGLADQLKNHGGILTGDGGGQLTVSSDSNAVYVKSDLDFTQTAMQITRHDPQSKKADHLVFNKPQNLPARWVLNIRHDRRSDQIHCQSDLNLDPLNTRVEADINSRFLSQPTELSTWPTRLAVQLTCNRLDQLKEILPEMFLQDQLIVGNCRFNRLTGPAQLQLQAEMKESSGLLKCRIDAENSAFTVQPIGDEEHLWQKTPGTPCRLEGEFQIDNLSVLTAKHNSLPSEPLNVRLPAFQLQLADNSAEIDGTMQWGADVDNRFPPLHLENCRLADINIQLNLDYDDGLARQIPQLNIHREHFGLSGRTRFDTNIHWDASQKTWSCSGNTNLDQTGILLANPAQAHQTATVGLNKPVGDPVNIHFDATGNEDLSDFTIKRFDLEMGENIVSASGTVKGLHWPADKSKSSTSDVQATINVSADIPKLDLPAKWIQLAESSDITGRFTGIAELAWLNAPTPRFQINSMKINSEVGFSAGDVPFHFAINDLNFASHELNVPAFEARCGQNNITVATQISFREFHNDNPSKQSIRPTGRIDLWSNRLNLDEVQTMMQNLTHADSAPPTPANWNYTTLLPLIRKFDLEGAVNINSLAYTDPKTQVRLTLEQLKNSWRLEENAFKADFVAGLNGGVAGGAVNADLTDPAVPIHYALISQKLRADDNLKPLVESEFPGMEVNGFISEQYELDSTLECLISSQCDWKGVGTSICEQGTLFGPGGPGWIIKVFPGLKLVEYSFKSMTNKWERFDDSRKNNHMVFKGDIYDIYLDGDSMPLRDPGQYDSILQQLKEDLENANQQVDELDAGKSKLSDALARQVRKQAENLAELWRRHETGQTLPIIEIDYVVGGLLSTAHKELFVKPKELLRVPIFRSQGYVIGQSMIGLKTTNVPLPGMK